MAFVIIVLYKQILVSYLILPILYRYFLRTEKRMEKNVCSNCFSYPFFRTIMTRQAWKKKGGKVYTP